MDWNAGEQVVSFQQQKRTNKTKRGNVEIKDSVFGNSDPFLTFSRSRKNWELVIETPVALLRSYWSLTL